MKILWHSNAPWVGTGYGQQTEQFAKHAIAAGHDVTISAFFGLNGTAINWDGMRVLPGGYDAFGNDVLVPHALSEFGGDPFGGVVITLMDVWCLREPELANLRLASWVPIDHTPVPPEVHRYFLTTKAVPIAMSEFGATELRRAGHAPLYAPHGIDLDVFKPTPTVTRNGKQVTARKAIGVPKDAFVVGINSANKGTTPPRKAFPQMFRAFSLFAARHEDAVLYLHTDIFGGADGLDLRTLAIACGIDWDRQVVACDQYAYRRGMPAEELAATYTAADVLLCTSMGEGFGIPVVESQACGVPVIVSDFSAQIELCGAGWRVPGEPSWDARQQAWWFSPDIASTVDALEAAYASRGELADEAVEFAQQYGADRVFAEHWVPILERLDRGPAALEVES